MTDERQLNPELPPLFGAAVRALLSGNRGFQYRGSVYSVYFAVTLAYAVRALMPDSLSTSLGLPQNSDYHAGALRLRKMLKGVAPRPAIPIV